MLKFEQLKRAESILLNTPIEIDLETFFHYPSQLKFDPHGRIRKGHPCNTPACLAGTLALSPDFPEITSYGDAEEHSVFARCFYTDVLDAPVDEDASRGASDVRNRDVFVFSDPHLDEATKAQSDRLFGEFGQGMWDQELHLHYLLREEAIAAHLVHRDFESHAELYDRVLVLVGEINEELFYKGGDLLPEDLHEVRNNIGLSDFQVAHYRILREMGVGQESARKTIFTPK